ncbi:hypothetical protein CQ016_14450 [Arthrobacter sp. MYb222]|nr:hypothetical protein CQ016_14450 [Arthrobacter sp. MYb222]
MLAAVMLATLGDCRLDGTGIFQYLGNVQQRRCVDRGGTRHPPDSTPITAACRFSSCAKPARRR